MTRPPFPVARGLRVPYRSLPQGLRQALDAHLGSPVVRATTKLGGFSPGVASVLQLRDGRRLFVKAVSAKVNAHAREIYRMEARIAAALPASVPAPKFRWTLERDPWIVLAFDAVDRSPPTLPWRREDLRRALRALESMSTRLTPSPLALPSFASAHAESFLNFRPLMRGGRTPARIPRWCGPWVRRNLAALADLEGRIGTASRGKTLLHSDCRADNLVFSPRRVYVVDWPWGCVGAPWVDLAAFLPSVAMQGGPPPWTIFERSPLARGAPAARVDAVVAALAGLFLFRGASPPVPELPGLRPFQWAQGVQALRWLRYRWEGEDPGFPRDRDRSD